MKKLSKILFVMVFALIGYINVYAIPAGTTVDFYANTNRDISYGSYEWGDIKDIDHPQRMYVSYSSNGITKYFDAYCEDPMSETATSSLYCYRSLLDGKSKESKQADAGLVAIFTNHSDKEYTINENNNFYHERTLAVRLYVNGFLGWNNHNEMNFYNGKSKIPGLRALAKEWTEELGKECPACGNDENTNSAGSISFTDDDAKALVKDMFQDAVRAYYSYNDKTSIPQISTDTVYNKVIENTDTEATNLVVVKFTAKNFTDAGEITFNGLSSDITYIGYKTSGDNLEKIDSYKSGSPSSKPVLKTFYMAYKVNYSYSTDGNKNKSFNIGYQYNDVNLTSSVECRDTSADSTGSGKYFQRFIIFDNSPKEDNHVIVVNPNPPCDPVATVPEVCHYDASITEKDVTYNYKEAYINGSYKIKACVLYGTDIAKNSAKLLTDDKIRKNDYCEVYCKEDYALTLPYRRDVESGRYFQISVAISGQMDCYSTKLDYELLDSNIKAKVAEMKEAKNNYGYEQQIFGNNESKKKEYEKTIETYQKAIDKYISDYNACVDWNFDYNFDPNITYSYDEPNNTKEWIDKVSKDNYDKMVSNNQSVAKITSEYCSGNVNDAYECSNGFNSGYTKISKTYVDYNDKVVTYTIPDVNFVHKYRTASGKYNTQHVYYSHVGNGAIAIEPKDKDNYNQVNGLPVSLNTPSGKYNYSINLDNIGQYYGTGENGRIYSSDNSISSVSNDVNDNYACYYEVNRSCYNNTQDKYYTEDDCRNSDNEIVKEHCKETEDCTIVDGEKKCKYVCDDEGWEACQKSVCYCDDKCPINVPTTYCVQRNNNYYVCDSPYFGTGEGCTIQNNKLAALRVASQDFNCGCDDHHCNIMIKNGAIFKPISPGNIDPNGNLGFNWNVNQKTNILVAEKARNTITEIENRADIDVDNTETVSNDYSIKVTLTPKMISDIRTYNKENSASGEYTNDTLKCYDYDVTSSYQNETSCKMSGYEWVKDGEKGKCVMTNIFCYSSFIDKLQEDYPENIKTNRDSSKPTGFKLYEGKLDKELDSGYSTYTNDYWTIYQFTNLDINGDGIPDVGPSWK